MAGVLEQLRDAGRAVAHAADVSALGHAAVDAAIRLATADRAAVRIFDPARVLRFVASYGLSERYRGTIEGSDVWTRLAIPRSSAPVVIPDLAVEHRLADLAAAALDEGIRAFAFVPLVHEGEVLGKLLVYFDGIRALAPDELASVEVLAIHVASRLASLRGAAYARDEAEARVRLLEDARAAREAEASERERLLVTLRSIGDAVVTTDADGVVTLLNGVAERLTGWTWDEARGRPLREVFRVFDERTGTPREDPVARVLREGRVVALANHTMIEARDGVRRAIADSAAPIVADDGSRVGVVLVFRDVTTQQRMEEELARASRLESLGVLAGGIAHDFNNILTAVVTNVSLAEAVLPAEHPARARLAGAGRACTRARDLTRQLLTFARGGAPVTTRVDVAMLVREACGFALQGSRTRASYELPDELWRVEADAGQISQVVHNLVLNAVQAMPEGGTLTASARNVEIEAGADLPLSPGRYVRIAVSDTGPGIAADILDRVFDPFFTTKPGGTGLGLATCHSIVHRHGGHISVASTSRGCTFHVWLPAAAAPAEAAGPTLARPLRGRVLVMDDDPELRSLAAACLAHYGFECDVTEDGARAVERWRDARREGRPYALVLLDLTVPGGMGGLDALRHMRAEDPMVRAVVSSGYSSDPVLAHFDAHGFAAAMQKPWGLPEVGRMLEDVLGAVPA
jgi:PAS domain S-box-containing protein